MEDKVREGAGLDVEILLTGTVAKADVKRIIREVVEECELPLGQRRDPALKKKVGRRPV